ncbi:hypothetical protein DMH04_53555 [Kibdelosporangium aridum]|uniref:Orc1-like AAA ATPase domain-containing protein n=1 Tax=Kibdelosporangium aridum TaxID=2030 RepID=A0A428Y312_KIBAR|nr:hypothetical protein DMH04_53555 [Kibdelosporangium aridum]
MADEIRGRDRELAQLADFAGAVAAGESRFALISGLPGTGRSRLLDAAGRHARDQGFTVLHGRATPATLRQPAAEDPGRQDRQEAASRAVRGLAAAQPGHTPHRRADCEPDTARHSAGTRTARGRTHQ